MFLSYLLNKVPCWLVMVCIYFPCFSIVLKLDSRRFPRHYLWFNENGAGTRSSKPLTTSRGDPELSYSTNWLVGIFPKVFRMEFQTSIWSKLLHPLASNEEAVCAPLSSVELVSLSAQSTGVSINKAYNLKTMKWALDFKAKWHLRKTL